MITVASTPSKAELLHMLTNPFLRGFFEKQATQAALSETKATAFAQAAIDLNDAVSSFGAEYFIAKKRQKEGASSDPDQEIVLSPEDQLLAKKMDFIRQMINNNGYKELSEVILLQAMKSIPQIEINRVEFAVENVKTKSNPQSLLDKILQTINNVCSEDSLFKLKTLQEFVKIENQSAMDRHVAQPYSQSFMTALDNQIATQSKLSELRQDLIQFKEHIALHSNVDTKQQPSQKPQQEEPNEAVNERPSFSRRL